MIPLGEKGGKERKKRVGKGETVRKRRVASLPSCVITSIRAAVLEQERGRGRKGEKKEEKRKKRNGRPSDLCHLFLLLTWYAEINGAGEKKRGRKKKKKKRKREE